MAYDIFISYRRRGGFETAKHLYDLLTKDGYRVSFDIDTLRNGDFDTELLRRIDECRDFILILSEGALDRCVDPSAVASADWVRCELAYALEKNKNIVPIMLAGFTAFPDNLPDDIRKVVRKNGPKYDSYYFDDFYRRLKSDFLETKPEERGDEDAYVTQLLKRLSALKSVPEPTDGQQAELGETYYELGRLASLHNRPDMLDYLPQALAIFRRLAEKEPERYRARIAESRIEGLRRDLAADHVQTLLLGNLDTHPLEAGDEHVVGEKRLPRRGGQLVGLLIGRSLYAAVAVLDGVVLIQILGVADLVAVDHADLRIVVRETHVGLQRQNECQEGECDNHRQKRAELGP